MSNEKRETGRKDDRPMVKVKKGNPAAPLLILRWRAGVSGALYPHPPRAAHARPAGGVAVFQQLRCAEHRGDNAEPDRPGARKSRPELGAVPQQRRGDPRRPHRMEPASAALQDRKRHRHPYPGRCGIPDDVEVYTFTKRDFLGKSEVTVSGQSFFSGVGSTGLFRQQGDIMTTYVLWTLGLMLLESAVKYQIEKKRKPRPAATAGQ